MTPLRNNTKSEDTSPTTKRKGAQASSSGSAPWSHPEQCSQRLGNRRLHGSLPANTPRMTLHSQQPHGCSGRWQKPRRPQGALRPHCSRSPGAIKSLSPEVGSKEDKRSTLVTLRCKRVHQVWVPEPMMKLRALCILHWRTLPSSGIRTSQHGSRLGASDPVPALETTLCDAACQEGAATPSPQ